MLVFTLSFQEPTKNSNMAKCSTCTKNITSKHLKMSCGDCKEEFHGTCAKMTKEDIDYLNSANIMWRCGPCSETRRKSMTFESRCEEGKVTLDDIMHAINEIKNSNKETERAFNLSYESLNEKLDENNDLIKKQSESLDEYVKIVEQLRSENLILKKKIKDLEEKVEDSEQYSRSNCLEIQGVPFKRDENVIEVVQNVGKAIGMELVPSMIDACHRLGRGNDDRPPGIIVKMVRRLDKEDVLKKRREKGKLSTLHMGLAIDSPIYINESLSPARRKLLAAARRFKAENHFKYIWHKNGKIFLRKDDGEPVLPINCEADLGKL